MNTKIKRYTLLIIVGVYIIIVKSFYLYAQRDKEDSLRWDQNMIREADIWQNLLVNYWYADRSFYWPERKQALMNLIEKFPNSQWADDATLLLAGGQASIEDDITGAINSLKKVIATYPSANTIITRWDSKTGCRINDGWLMWAPDLVSFKQDRTINTTFPFDSEDNISILEKEALTYFEHLEKYPQFTKDVAQFMISLMLREQGDISGAITELENLLAAYHDLSAIRAADYEAAIKPNGYLIECEPPFDVMPIWRVQYDACMLLINLYRLQGKKDKALELSLKLPSNISPDGWYWKINSYVGDICAQNDEWNLAAEQYELSIKGIRKIAKDKAIRMKTLYEQGNMIKPEGFLSWEDEALKSHGANIIKIENSLRQLRLH